MNIGAINNTHGQKGLAQTYVYDDGREPNVMNSNDRPILDSGEGPVVKGGRKNIKQHDVFISGESFGISNR